eukprot:SM000096S24915  [mRNA]  locus=s96:513674:519301:- [translate_table: standard]
MAPAAPRRWRAACLLALAALLSLAAVGCGEPLLLGDADVKRELKKLYTVKKNGSYGSLKATYQAVQAIAILGSGPSNPDTCSFAEGADTPDAASAYFALGTAAILRCSGAKDIAEKVLPIFLDTIKSSDDLIPLMHSLNGLCTMKDFMLRKVEVDDALIKSVPKKLKALAANGGTWKMSASDSTPTLLKAGWALQAFTSCGRLGTFNVPELEFFKEAITTAFASTSSSEDGEVYFDDPDGEMFATSVVLMSYIQLATYYSHVPTVEPKKILGIAEYFRSLGFPTGAKECLYMIEALGTLSENRHACTSLAVRVPPSVSITTGRLKVSVTNALGLKVPLHNVKLFGIKPLPSGKTASVSEDFVPGLQEPTVFLGEFPKKGTILGKYLLKFEVAPASNEHSKFYAGTVSETVMVTGAVAASDAKLVLLDSDGSVNMENVLEYGKSTPVSISATHLQKLHFSVKLTGPDEQPFIPQQAFIKLEHTSGTSHLYLLGFNQEQGTFGFQLDFLELMKSLYHLSGDYTLELHVGDNAMDNPFTWPLAVLSLDLPAPPDGSAKPPARVTDLKQRYGPKAEISHIFRVPEKRPPLVVSYVFMILTLVPLVGLLGGLRALGINVALFPNEGGPSVSAVLFHAGIAATLLLYIAFWVKVGLFTTLKLLLPLGLFTSAAGFRILSYLADSSVKLKST